MDPPVSDVTFFGPKEVGFHGFSWFYMVSWFYMAFGWCPWFFMVFGWFPWFFKLVSWSFMVFGWFPWFTESWPNDPNLGLAGRRPALV